MWSRKYRAAKNTAPSWQQKLKSSFRIKESRNLWAQRKDCSDSSIVLNNYCSKPTRKGTPVKEKKGKGLAKKPKVQRTTTTLAIGTIDIIKNTGINSPAFTVKVGKEILGRLEIGSGSLIWYAKNVQNPTKKLSWKEFAKLMES